MMDANDPAIVSLAEDEGEAAPPGALVLDPATGKAPSVPDPDAPVQAGVPNPYPLKHPIKVEWKGGGGTRMETIDELKLRRATGVELQLLDRFANQPMRLVLEMIAALSGRSIKIIEKLDGEDIGPLADLAFSNVPDGRPTGAST